MPSFASAPHRGRLSVCLVVCFLGWLPSCQSQDELRSIIPQYAKSFDLNGLKGGNASYGNDGFMMEKKFFYPLAQQDGKLFVGARNELFSLDSATFEMMRSVSIPSWGNTTWCTSNICNNFVRLVQPLPDGDLLVCSTNSLKPYCQTRSPEDLSNSSTREAYTGFNTLPFVPHQNFSWLLLNDTVFAGANEDSLSSGSLRDPTVARAYVSDPVPKVTVNLRTKIDDTVLKGESVNFVGDPIEYNGRIYFFFREIAEESIDNQMYSRVGVVCMNDGGGVQFSDLNERNLVTFVKARLGCSLGGSFPYVYNEIRDTYQSTVNETVVFAIFATRPVGVASSAVCAFRLDEIETLFLTGSKFYHAATGYELVSYPVTPRQATCPDTTSYNNLELSAILNNGQLMYNSVEDTLLYDTEVTSQSLNPLLVSDGERYSQIVVDEDVLNSLDVMFIGTEKGTVLKAYLNEARTEARVVEEIRLEPSMTTPVLSMLKSEDGQAVFVSTIHGVYRVPVQHCLDYPTREECLDIRDPYCSWNATHCVNSPGDHNLDEGSGVVIEPAITFRHTPQNRRRVMRIASQPINLFLSAEVTPPGRNPRVRGDEIPCDQCASLPYTTATLPLSDSKELLLLHIDGSSGSETVNCSCSCVVEVDGGVNATANFTIIADDSELSPISIANLAAFDEGIFRYKQELLAYLERVGALFDLEDLQFCPTSGCT